MNTAWHNYLITKNNFFYKICLCFLVRLDHHEAYKNK